MKSSSTEPSDQHSHHQALMKFALEAAEVGYWELDPVTGQFLFNSDRALAMLGLPPGTPLTHEKALACLHPDDRPHVDAAIAAARERGEPFHVDVRVPQPDGSIRWLTSSAGLLLAPTGKRIVGLVRDITARKRAEAALRESETRLRLAMDASAASTWLWDAQTNQSYWDDRYHAMFGFKPDEPRSYEAWIKRLHADDQPRVLARIDEILNTPDDNDWNVEFRAVLPDGEIHLMHGLGRADRDANGKVLRLAGINLDITGQKRSEAALRKSEELNRSTLQALPAHIAVVDGQGRIVAVNLAWTEFASGNAARGHPSVTVEANYLDVCRRAAVLNADAAQALAGIEAVLAGETPLFTMEYPCHSPQEQRWFLMTVVPLRGIDQGGAVISHLNVTDRKRAEAVLRESLVELEAAKAKAERANAAKSRFLAAASHDLRQPLQAATVYRAVLNEQAETPEQRETCAKLQVSLQAMAGILNTLLDLSRLEAGSLTPKRSSFALDSILERIAVNARPLAEQKGLSFDFPKTGLEVNSDPDLLERILENFVTNAIRFTAKGRVSLGAMQEGNIVRISVMDSGIGIPEDAREHIFEEYVQLDNPARNSSKGLGLGLSIVKRLAELLDHPVSVSSTRGEGSTFAVAVPLA